MSVTPQDAVRSAEEHVRGGRTQEESVRDYLAFVAHLRPAYDSPGSAAEEVEIHRLATRAQTLHPAMSFAELAREARDTVLWWRWPIDKQVGAWLKGRWPFDGERNPSNQGHGA